MTREEILRMAESVGFYLVDFVDDDKSVIEQIQADNSESLYSFAALVAAAEREACEQICERQKSLYWMEFDKTGSDADRAAAIASEECADAIRARGQ